MSHGVHEYKLGGNSSPTNAMAEATGPGLNRDEVGLSQFRSVVSKANNPIYFDSIKRADSEMFKMMISS